MHFQALARSADEAKQALEAARVKLELTARRFAERPGARARRELQRRAEEFAAAQRTLEDAVREWARALQTHERARALQTQERRLAVVPVFADG
jgi:transposase InsO family protein